MSPTFAAVGFGALLAVGAAQPAGAPPAPHVLVVIAEMLLEKKLPQAAEVVVRLGLSTSDLSQAERARLHLVDATLLANAKDEQGARQAIASALSLDPAAMLPDVAPARLREIMEDARALSIVQRRPPAPASASPRQPPAKSMVKAVDELYKSLQLEAADLVLQLATQYQPLLPEDRVQLMLRRGLVKLELFDEAEARRAFQEALDTDRTTKLPAGVSPKAQRILEELRMALPAPAPPPPPLEEKPAMPRVDRATGPRLRSWAWAPAAGGVALGVTGGILYWQAKANYGRLATHDPTIRSGEQLQAIDGAGRAFQTSSFVLFGAGAAALASSAVMFFGEKPGELHPSVQVSPGAVSFAVMGELP